MSLLLLPTELKARHKHSIVIFDGAKVRGLFEFYKCFI